MALAQAVLQEGRPAHTFRAAGHVQLAGTRLDGVGGQHDAFHPAAAGLVDERAPDPLGQAGAEADLTRQGQAGARADDVAEQQLLDIVQR